MVNQKYHVILNSQGYMIEEQTYKRILQPPFVPRFSSGNGNYGDLSFWQYRLYNSVAGGAGQKRMDPAHTDRFDTAYYIQSSPFDNFMDSTFKIQYKNSYIDKHYFSYWIGAQATLWDVRIFKCMVSAAARVYLCATETQNNAGFDTALGSDNIYLAAGTNDRCTDGSWILKASNALLQWSRDGALTSQLSNETIAAAEKTQVNEVIDDTEQQFTVDSTTGMAANEVYKIDNEKVLVKSVDSPTVITVVRGVNNTTAATHTDDSKLYLCTYDFTFKYCFLMPLSVQNSGVIPPALFIDSNGRIAIADPNADSKTPLINVGYLPSYSRFRFCYWKQKVFFTATICTDSTAGIYNTVIGWIDPDGFKIMQVMENFRCNDIIVYQDSMLMAGCTHRGTKDWGQIINFPNGVIYEADPGSVNTSDIAQMFQEGGRVYFCPFGQGAIMVLDDNGVSTFVYDTNLLTYAGIGCWSSGSYLYYVVLVTPDTDGEYLHFYRVDPAKYKANNLSIMQYSTDDLNTELIDKYFESISIKFKSALQAPTSVTTLNGGINDNTLSVVVADATNLAAGNVIQIGSEQMVVSSILSNTLSITPGTRGYNSTTAAAHLTGVAVQRINHNARISYSIDDGTTWTQAGTITMGDGTSFTMEKTVRGVGKRIKVRVSLMTADETTTPEVETVIIKYVLAPLLKKAWGFSIRANQELKLIDGTREPKTAAELTAAPWTALALNVPVVFTDIDGSSYNVLITDIQEDATLINTKVPGERYVTLELMEV